MGSNGFIKFQVWIGETWFGDGVFMSWYNTIDHNYENPNYVILHS
jgi:hypothetical protein